MNKYIVIFGAIISFCASPEPLPEVFPSQLQIHSQRLILPADERALLFIQSARQRGLFWLPPQGAVILEEMKRRDSNVNQLANFDTYGRAGNWGGVQFTYNLDEVIYRRYAFDIFLEGFCGGALRIFLFKEKILNIVPVDNNLSNFSANSNCPDNLTPHIPLKVLHKASELAREAIPLEYSYRLLAGKVEISFPGDIP